MENNKPWIPEGSSLAYPVIQLGSSDYDNGRLASPKRISMRLAAIESAISGYRQEWSEAMRLLMDSAEREAFKDIPPRYPQQYIDPLSPEQAARQWNEKHPYGPFHVINGNTENPEPKLHQWAKDQYEAQHRNLEPQISELTEEVKQLRQLVDDLRTSQASLQNRVEDLIAEKLSKKVRIKFSALDYEAAPGVELPDDELIHLGFYNGRPVLCKRQGIQWWVDQGFGYHLADAVPVDNTNALVWLKKIS